MISVIRASSSSEPTSAAFANFSCHVLRSSATIFCAFARISSGVNGAGSAGSSSSADSDGVSRTELSVFSAGV